MESASVAHDHHGPPPANQSSRVEAQFLGMLLFIISEVMLFGAFFTAYFFLRVVNRPPCMARRFPDLAPVRAQCMVSEEESRIAVFTPATAIGR